MKTPTKANMLSTVLLAGLVTTTAWAATPTFTDTNNDGVISADEIQTARELAKAERLTQFDTDGDGTLSDEEKNAMKDARKAEHLSLNDTDGNGELSRAERRAAKVARRAAIEAQLDVNQDGVVSDAEGAGFDQLREERHTGKRGDRKGKRNSQSNG